MLFKNSTLIIRNYGGYLSHYIMEKLVLSQGVHG